jgi:hypothetical protein
MDWVLKYFNKNNFSKKAPNPKLQDLYLCVFWPAAVGQADNYVIAPAGSQVATQNIGLQDGTGQITCASVGAVVQQRLVTVKQALANAGVADSSPGQLSSGSGIGVTDGSGNPVNAGNGSVATGNLGPQQAAGKSVSNTCPIDWLGKSTIYKAPASIGSGSPKLTQDQVTAMHAELGYFESAWKYDQVSQNNNLIGKYQVDASYLAMAGYIKPDAVAQYGSAALGNPNSWTGRDGIGNQAAFLSNTSTQDSIQNKEFSSNYDALMANSGITSSDDLCTAAGMLFVAHMFRSAALAAEWRKTGTVATVPSYYGLAGSPEDYYNHGRYAIDVLSAGGTQTNTGTTAPPDGINTTGIDPNKVLIFSTGTGSLEAFKQTSSEFQTALLNAAQAYLSATGKKITINSAYRDSAYQQGLYDRWRSAGGHYASENPPGPTTVAGLTIPSKPVPGRPDSHGSGVAIDSSQSPLVNQTINLPSFGLRWGGTFGDQVHIELATWHP